MKQLFLILLLYSTGMMSQNTAINTGINTKNPGSRLTVDGSFAGDYKIVSGDFTLDDSDFYIVYNRDNKATIKLPKAISGPGNFKGRIYGIKNISRNQQSGYLTVTPEALGLEKIDAAGDVDYITIPPGHYAELISKGTTTGTTWELSMLVPVAQSSKMTHLLNVAIGMPKNSSPQSTFTLSPPTTLDVVIPGTQKTFSLDKPKTVFFNFTVGLGLINFFSPGDYYHFYRCELFINNSPTQIFQVVQEHSKSIQFSMSGVYDLPAGTHTIEARLSSWHDFGQARNLKYGILSLLLSAFSVD
ncbi:hypothetical protein ASG38_00415 [Flavobacterium sp. Leaf359]|jgi:hypothetical protein|uniref:hypothetical protein n=1 Tax=Flavobacterium sp. Leaf359 TaxID=1736351 RepID=UPI0007021B94|nr:hypothetical protein [Flavobacterium sp. Leaf359]KQS53235.1 hypothetical protein ASG38_00415 [Flavobacterium sp. Leaf359]